LISILTLFKTEVINPLYIMKKLLNIFSLIVLLGLNTACFEDYNERWLFTDLRVEFQNAVIQNPSAGLDYPLVATLRNEAGLRQYQVNLFGGLSDKDQVIPVRIVAEHTTAVQGTHFNLPNGLEVLIPAGEAFGSFDIFVPTLENTAAVRLVVELESNADVKASGNHKKIGLDFRR